QAKSVLEGLSRAFSKHPRAEEFQRDLAAARESLGALLAARDQVQPALKEYQAALAVRQRQALENPAVPDFQSDLAQCDFNLALLQARAREPARALESLQKAVERQRTLVATVPDEKPYVRALARQLMYQARLQKEAGTHDESRQSYRLARDLWEKLLSPPGPAAQAPAMLAPAVWPAPLLALHGLSLQHFESLSAPTGDFLDLAAARAASGDDGPALAALRQALAAGCKEPDAVQAVPEFTALRPREDFQALLKTMKER